MWESGDLLVLSRTSPVLLAPLKRLGLGLTFLNAVLWLVAIILQGILLPNVDSNLTKSSYSLVGICLGWSVTIFIVTIGSIYHLIRNTIKDIKSFLTLTLCTAVLSFVIFVSYLVTLNLDTATEYWLNPAGYSIFTGVYVAGESCLIVWFFGRQWKTFQSEMKEERMDRVQQRMREQQQQHLSVLTHSSQLTPSLNHGRQLEMNDTPRTSEDIRRGDGASDVDSDRFTYYPPVFV